MPNQTKGREIRIIRRGEERPPQPAAVQISARPGLFERLSSQRRPLSEVEARAALAELFKE